MSSGLKIIFAGTPEFAAVALQALLDSDHEVCAVYTQPDRPAGRGRKLSPSPVKQLAEAHHVPVYQPVSLKDPAAQEQLRSLHADLMVVVAYGLLLPAPVLDAPRYGCINVHASLLPRWRGAAPIQRAILAGDQETGVTIMQMEQGLDTGPMLMKLPETIYHDDTAGRLHDRLAACGAEALIAVCADLQIGNLEPEVQDESLSNYARKLDKSEASLDWRQPAEVLFNQVRAFNPWPVATCIWGDKTLRIWSAHYILEPVTQAPGTVIAQSKAGIDVATGKGVLRLIQLQLPGGRALSAQEFSNAHTLTGETLQ